MDDNLFTTHEYLPNTVSWTAVIWDSSEHRHSAIAQLTPEMVYYGLVTLVRLKSLQQARVLFEHRTTQCRLGIPRAVVAKILYFLTR